MQCELTLFLRGKFMAGGTHPIVGIPLLWASISLSDPSLQMQNVCQQFGEETVRVFFTQASKMVLLLSADTPPIPSVWR